MRKSKRFLFIALAVTIMLSACVKTEQDSSSGDNISSQTGDISSSQIDEISSSQSENGTSSSDTSSQSEYAPAISETYEKYNDLSFMPPEAKKVYEENNDLLWYILTSPTSIGFGQFEEEYGRLTDENGNDVYFDAAYSEDDPRICRYMVTKANYTDFEKKLSEFCTERETARVLRAFKNYNGYLAAIDVDGPYSGPGKDDDTELCDVYTANDEQIAFLYILGTDGERKIGYLVELVKENDVWKFNYMEKCSISGGKRDY